ncbi:MmpS family protein [Micromonospora sp. RHAY321]|uniref:MmpS family transport accessory protein n=1 Tax=Micromonospora sp. RHAY321 TaxID=2944807 RepID=UPI00207D5023|nr:MmpS family transport accessory protein [Micromonospora sp. RHAY321]MCO1598318.1 MmpS family protein [Micromonospora sp. RHAY321]
MSDASPPDPSPTQPPDPTPSPDPSAAGSQPTNPTSDWTSPGAYPAPDPLAPGQPWAPPPPWTPGPLPPSTGTDPSPAGYPPSGWAPAGHGPSGWPPPGYPPPYLYPGYPQGGPPSGGNGRMVGIVVAVVAAVTLALCGCLCAAGPLIGLLAPDPVAEDPYDDGPFDDDRWSPPTTAPTTTAPTPSKKPITRPTSGPAPVTVVYEITGNGEADISYYDAESDLIHVDRAKLPWRTTIRTSGQSRVMVEAIWSDIDNNGPLDCTLTMTGSGSPVVDRTLGYWMTTCTPE